MKSLAVLGLVALFAQADAATNSWTNIGPYGGQALKVAYHRTSPSIVYLTSVGGFSRSMDGGFSWQMVFTDSLNPPADLAVDPSNPDRLYLVFVNPPYLLTSSDAGQTVAPVANFPVNLENPSQIQISGDGQTLYVTAGTRVVCSTDRGQTWAERTVVDADSTRRVLELIIDPADANTLYADVYSLTGENGIYVTHDGAHSWTQSFWSTSTTHYVQEFSINPLNPNTVWAATYDGLLVSYDRAVSWTLSNFNAATGAGVSTVTTDPHNPATVYASTPWGLIKKSVDGGTNWTDITSNSFIGQPATLTLHPTSSGTILAGGSYGVWGTANDGLSWSSQVQGLLAQNILHFSAAAASDRIYFNTNSSFVGYVAGGATSVNSINEAALHSLAGTSVVGPAQYLVSSVLSQPGANGNLYVSLVDGLAISPDGGSSWSLKTVTNSGSQQLEEMTTWPGLPQTILGAGTFASYRSGDGGNLWSLMSSGLPTGTTLFGIYTAPSDSTIAYALPDGTAPNSPVYGLYRTTDSGLTWAPVGGGSVPGINLWAIDPNDAQTLYATNNSAFLKSTDGGASYNPLNWDPNAQGLPFRVAVDPGHANIVYAANNMRISRSVDGGSSWQVLPAPPTSSNWATKDLILDPNRPSDVLVGTGRNGVFKMTIAPDLMLATDAGSSLVAGQPFTYHYTASNKGPFDATGVHVAVNLPAGIQNLTATTSAGSCKTNSGVPDCAVSVLRTGESFTVTIAATAPAAATPVQFSGQVSGDQPDAVMSNNAIQTPTQVNNESSSPATTATASADSGGKGGGGAVSLDVLAALSLVLLSRGRLFLPRVFSLRLNR